MNKNLSCNIHSNYPIFHIDLLEGAKKKLQCIKCISIKKRVVSNLLIPEIINFDEKPFLENWPPLSDELLRKKIIDLKNDNKDLNQSIVDFYDQLTQEINQILSEKKKEQLINAQKIYELKDQIIEQYQKMASINQIKSCIIQESQELEKIEQDLKDLIDSQFSKKEEYTSILSCMMQQYELISQFDIFQPTLIKQNILEILKIVDLIPQKQFNFRSEIDSFRFDNINTLTKRVEEENKIIQKDKKTVENLVEQLQACNEQLIKKINSKGWRLDSIIISILRNSSDYLSVQLNTQSKYQIERIKNGQQFVSCFFNYILKPQKKYIIRINLFGSNEQSKFFLGLISTQNLDKFDLSQKGLGFLINSIKNNIFQLNTSQSSLFTESPSLFFNQNQNQSQNLDQPPFQQQKLRQNLFSVPEQPIEIANLFQSSQIQQTVTYLFSVPKQPKAAPTNLFQNTQRQQQQESTNMPAQNPFSNPVQPQAGSIKIQPQQTQKVISNIFSTEVQPKSPSINLFQNNQRSQQEESINNGAQNLFSNPVQRQPEQINIFSNIQRQQQISNLNQNQEESINMQPQQVQKVEQKLFSNPFLIKEESINKQPQQVQKVTQNLFQNPVNQQSTFLNQNIQESLFNIPKRQFENAHLYNYTQVLEFRVYLKDQYFQYSDYPFKNRVNQYENKKNIQIDGEYHFGFEFYSDYIKDKLEIIDFQELDEFPNK
ncbi:hypothetical protein ABPG72_011403 [Tetrahymena utriculariae]